VPLNLSCHDCARDQSLTGADGNYGRGRTVEIGAWLAVEQRTDVQIGASGDGNPLQSHLVAAHRGRVEFDQ
jgi:hypothetical protein